MKGQTAGRSEGLSAGARQRGGIARMVGRRERRREGEKTLRPSPRRAPAFTRRDGLAANAGFAAGVPLSRGQCGTGGCPTGRGRLRPLCGASRASPRLSPRSLPRPGKRLHFPALPSSERALRGSLAGSRHLLPSQGARRGGARQPRPRSPPSPPLPPCRRGAGGARRRKPERHTAAAERGGGQRHAGCRLPPLPGALRPPRCPR